MFEVVLKCLRLLYIILEGCWPVVGVAVPLLYDVAHGSSGSPKNV